MFLLKLLRKPKPKPKPNEAVQHSFFVPHNSARSIIGEALDLIVQYARDEVAGWIAAVGAGVVVAASVLGGVFGSDAVNAIINVVLSNLTSGVDMGEVRAAVRSLDNGVLPDFDFTGVAP